MNSLIFCRFINMFSSKRTNLQTIIRELSELCGNISKFCVFSSLFVLLYVNIGDLGMIFSDQG